MSYQLPDLLTFLTSISSSSSSNTEYDGELHINPIYASLSNSTGNSDSSDIINELDSQLHSQRPTESSKKEKEKDKLRKTVKEFLDEYNPGLLACLYLPFLSNNEKEEEEEGVMKVVKEWLSVCAIGVEETVRPGRIIGVGDQKERVREVVETIANRLMRFSNLNTRTINQNMTNILNASQHPPPPPPTSTSTSTSTRLTEYLNWRIDLSGHQLLLMLFVIPPHTHKYTRAIELILEIGKMKDLFAYNIHQAWSNPSHLNLISYLLLCGGGMTTVQGGVNMIGEMIRLRMVELKHELENEKEREGKEEKEVNGLLTSIFSPFFSSSSSSSSNNNDDKDLEIRKTLWNWVSGIIHWAYEVEYFTPDLERNMNKKKRGGEVRDYGWVFLIPNQ
ncbi:hypothetical protein AGABI2DRAFT_122351 [Agaricus bisporus var. bisporus H97]|uniref:hypothetical protein n=1 Tax=Agaricus bisporus var. bisporus (strain H97 / ATCC MYA-4626 / FGSC 10389) TaxID=936046 RepID=UPI00029F51E7|nr:hypothetical protein AGABI2DRAFT_122351 [Agaricus bisporus var. bisporus H97]EKV42770.1 hypothetical protein AGABI2DRAFT_122351 [Agaricus bisporus var. bisporus H97]